MREANLVAVVRVIVRGWRPVVVSAAVLGLVGLAGSLHLRNYYRVDVVMLPVQQSSNSPLSMLKGQFGGLAALAGVNLGASDNTSIEWIATLTSKRLVREFIVTENLTPMLFEERWDSAGKQWSVDENDIPTTNEAVERILNDVIVVSEDRRTGLVTLRIEWYDPVVAAAWANRLVEFANMRIREQAIRNTERSIRYLNKELERTSIVELRQAIFGLVENEVQKAMLASVQDEYAFRVIDPASAPDEDQKSGPKRGVITVLCMLFGGMLGALGLLWRYREEWLS